MSGIAGLFVLEGPPPDAAMVGRMMATLAHRGSDGQGIWRSGPVAMGHGARWTTPEAEGETQPWSAPSGSLVIAMDGRLDDREPLRVELTARGFAPRSTHDAELALRAYECWGRDFPRALHGDFAIALWDAARRTLFCARDPLGVKPFYYQSDGRIFRWGSEPQAILEDPRVSRVPNEGMVAEMLCGYLVSREDTLWDAVKRLPPGHSLTASCTGITVSRYWPTEPVREIRYRSGAEYAEHFRTLLEGAVRDRLRALGPVGAHLSGGVDSSSVVALGQRLIETGEAHGRLEAFTQCYPDLPDDERPFAEETAARCGVKWHPLLPSAPGPDYYFEQARRHLDFPDYPNGAAGSLAMTRLAAGAGCRVMLTGIWGNAFLEGSTEHLADLLGGLRVVEAVRRARQDVPLLTEQRLLDVLFDGGLRPLAPPRLRRLLSPVFRRRIVPEFVPADFPRRVRLLDRLRAPQHVPAYATFAQRAVFRGGLSAWNIHGGEVSERGAARLGVEERHPFADRRVVEFCLALPEEQRWHGQTLKVVLREAMRGILPERVRTKQTQPELGFLHMEALEAAGGERAFQNLRVAARGWVDADRTRALYRRAAAMFESRDPRYADLVVPLWTVHGLELWLRAIGGEDGACR